MQQRMNRDSPVVHKGFSRSPWAFGARDAQRASDAQAPASEKGLPSCKSRPPNVLRRMRVCTYT
eukprot:15441547-Alexandrium_andersonii.AAC.1